MTNMLVVAAAVRVLHGVHRHAAYLGPAVALGLVLPVRLACTARTLLCAVRPMAIGERNDCALARYLSCDNQCRLRRRIAGKVWETGGESDCLQSAEASQGIATGDSTHEGQGTIPHRTRPEE